MLQIKFSTKMKHDYRRMKKSGKDMRKLDDILFMLAKREPLLEHYRDHALTGNFKGSRECHIEPDWLLIYKIYEKEVILFATDTGTHSDLFGM